MGDQDRGKARRSAIDGSELTLVSGDGTKFLAFAVRATQPRDIGIVVLPDVRGLHPYYADLARRLASAGFDSIAFDYFGRTAGVSWRDTGFDYMRHIEQTTCVGQASDLRAALAYLRSRQGGGARRQCALGFSLGGRLALVGATLGLGLERVVAFYARLVGPAKNDLPEPIAVAGAITARVLAFFGDADETIPSDTVEAFAAALAAAGVDHRVVVCQGAPHSFFDRRANEFEASADAAWGDVLTFLGS